MSKHLIESSRVVPPGQLLVCTTHAKVYALDRRNGVRVWKNEVKGVNGILSVFISNDLVIISGSSKVVALDIVDGVERWRNRLPGMGGHPVAILAATEPDTAASRDDQPPPYCSPAQIPSQLSSKSVILALYAGKVIGINRHDGKTLWRFDCPKSNSDLPSGLLDISSPERAFIGCGLYLYCLELVTGRCLWQQQVSRALIGFGYMTMADHAGSQRAAYASTSFDNYPAPQANEIQQCDAL
ncbi:hypothetical protein BC937DRAFT_91447 [Endogone sp. FLAS-F59071]|nr:hypothetical protein BC937DRAFT_91447 [Endogone sp. FLAS-F59071]|eukprot:RUS16247.1 hypothetical protein BC937DRAFT_91447 [Endogone sp. FLAS-F59071]